MLVKLKSGYDYGEYWNEKLTEGAMYVVLAMQVEDGKASAYINMSKDGYCDVSHFDLKDFEVVDGTVPEEWRTVYFDEFKAWILAYPEWLNYQHVLDAHDYNGINDLDAFWRFFKKYEAKYAERKAKITNNEGVSGAIRISKSGENRKIDPETKVITIDCSNAEGVISFYDEFYGKLDSPNRGRDVVSLREAFIEHNRLFRKFTKVQIILEQAQLLLADDDGRTWKIDNLLKIFLDTADYWKNTAKQKGRILKKSVDIEFCLDVTERDNPVVLKRKDYEEMLEVILMSKDDYVDA